MRHLPLQASFRAGRAEADFGEAHPARKLRVGRCEAAGGRLFIPRSPASFHGAPHRFVGRGGVGRVLSHLRKGSHLSLRSCALLGHHDGPVRVNEAHWGVLESSLYCKPAVFLSVPSMIFLSSGKTC